MYGHKVWFNVFAFYNFWRNQKITNDDSIRHYGRYNLPRMGVEIQPKVHARLEDPSMVHFKNNVSWLQASKR